MSPIFQVLAVVLAGWLNRHQQRVLDYQLEENRILKRQLRGRRLRLSEDDRCRLAVRGRALGRRLLVQFASIVTPETILRWHRNLIAQKWTFPTSRFSRKKLVQKIAELAVRMARENVTWGYDRIRGALKHLGHVVAPNTIKSILKEHGIDPVPERRHRSSWRQFLRIHVKSIAAADFFTTEVWTAQGLVTWCTFFVIDLATRAVEIIGSTPNPDEALMAQVARNLTNCVDEFLLGKRFLILDRDKEFSEAFRDILKGTGVRTILSPPCAPNCNVFAERFVRSITTECLDRMNFFGAGPPRRALAEYSAHYYSERTHQGIGNKLIRPRPTTTSVDMPVQRRQRLGGLLNFYKRRAA